MVMMGWASIAAAEVITTGPKGGVFCSDERELLGMILIAAMGDTPPPGKTCSVIKPGAVITTDKTTSVNKGMVMGKGDVVENGTTRSGFFTVAIPGPKLTSDGRTFKRLKPADVRNAPSKWSGRDIEFAGVNVYWVDDDDVRIVTDQRLTIFATEVRGTDRDFFKQNCETEDEALSRKCKATVRFAYIEFDEDTPTGFIKRTVLKSDDVEIVRPAGRR